MLFAQMGPQASAPPAIIELTDIQGRTINAAVLAVDKTTVTLLRVYGVKFTFPLARLSREDRKRVETMTEWFKPPGEIQLMAGWENERRKGEEGNVINDLAAIMEGLAEPTHALAVPERFPLFQEVRMLDDIEIAKQKLKLGTLSKADFILPGFPNRSFYTYRGSVRIDGYETIFLLTDARRQVVAVELSSSQPEAGNPGLTVTSDRNCLLHDMLNYSMRAISTAKVDWRILSKETHVVVLTSGFYAPERNSFGPFTGCQWVRKNATELYLPTQLIGLVLFNIQTNWRR